jgi:hypothetical protein
MSTSNLGTPMKWLYKVIILFLCVTLLGISAKYVSTQPEKQSKKLIEYGWDVPVPSFVRKNIQQMEKTPFEGIVIQPQEGKQIFLRKPYNQEKFTQDMEDLKATKFSKFTDNFILMWATAEEEWDWFSESDWKASEHNIRLFAQTAKAGKFVGVAFDPEPYKDFGTSPWSYPDLPSSKEKSFAEYSHQVRKRGSQFIQVLQQELPNVKMLNLFLLSYFSDFLDGPNSVEQMRKLSTMQYGLLPAFLNGILDVVRPNTIIIDGNERSFYYTDRKTFDWFYKLIHEKVIALIDPKNRSRYVRQIRVGQALYIDHLFALRQPSNSTPSYKLTPEKRAKWLEHNTYYGLLKSDEYLWCYSEKMNWWTYNVPDGIRKAIQSARQKIERGESLGFNLDDLFK